MLVDDESIPRLDMYKLGFCLQVSSAKWDESMTVHSFQLKVSKLVVQISLVFR